MSKYDRQMRMQHVAIDVLRSNPSLLSDPRLRTRLNVISENTQGELYHRCLGIWQQLLGGGDVDRLSQVVLSDTEQGGYMRTTSPLGVLLNDEQRRSVVYGSALTAA